MKTETKIEPTTLTNDAAVEEIKSRVKPYVGVKNASGGYMSQGYFSNMCARIKAGLCKPGTVDEFLSKFGYSGDWNAWTKTEGNV